MESSASENSINNKYTILEKKGKGATAKVYLVEENTTKKHYAAKILIKIISSFEREVDILKRVSSLNNPYIINLIDYGEGPVKLGSNPEETKQFAVLEYASKGVLFDYISLPKEGFPEKYAKLIFSKILKGIQACHTAGICHRDLKMENILVDDNFNPKICDFGFAADIKGEDGSGKLTQYLGTVNYAAPEIFLHRPYDGIKADIFSLGVVLINIVTCKIGFLEATRRDKYYKYIMAKRYPKYWDLVTGVFGNISENLKNLYIKMVSFSPDERPSINDILNDPWMKEIKDLNKNDLELLEKELYEEFEKRETLVKKSNENLDSQSSSEISLNSNRSGADDDKEYFDLSLTPKYIQKTGLNMNNYLKINGNLHPCKFMNCLANKIKKDFGENCNIEECKNKLKFDIKFESELEDEENEEDQNLEEELDKLGLENIDEFDDTIEKKDCIIQVKLFKSLKGGHILRFVKKRGEIDDYYKNLNNIKSIVKKIL